MLLREWKLSEDDNAGEKMTFDGFYRPRVPKDDIHTLEMVVVGCTREQVEYLLAIASGRKAMPHETNQTNGRGAG